MQALVLGAAAGGGFPQWNCGCPNCTRARNNDPATKPRTQASIAISAEPPAPTNEWLIVGASPDLRQQILANPQLTPPPNTRNSPIAAILLVSADIDGIAGLLTLREQHKFKLYAPASILAVLQSNGIFASLDPALVDRIEIAPNQPIPTTPGLTATLLEMPGKIPLYQEERSAAQPAPATTYAARLQSAGKTIIVAPACADITPQVLTNLAGANLIFFDGTLYQDNEMIDAGLSWKTGRRMGHVSLAGPHGTLAKLAPLPARKILFHINNTNPILLDDSPEHAAACAAGFEVSFDGLHITL